MGIRIARAEGVRATMRESCGGFLPQGLRTPNRPMPRARRPDRPCDMDPCDELPVPSHEPEPGAQTARRQFLNACPSIRCCISSMSAGSMRTISKPVSW